jgi:hypothetical protein
VTLDIPSDLFAFEPFPYVGAPENFVVVTDDVDAAVEGLTRAGDRMICVDEAGVEHPDYEAANAGGVYAPPSYVADPKVTAAGVVGYVDCKGSMSSKQAAMFRTILRQELEAAGVTGTVRTFWYDESGRPLIDD